MIISRTPFRVSFVGGGTDLPSFYRSEPGDVVSTTINQYMFVTVHRLSPFSPHRIRVSYSKTELVNEPEELEHPIVRQALLFLAIHDPIEITSIADIPAGTGLGSSSSFTVGLLNALHAYKGTYASAEQLAREASHIEIDLLGEPIGRQDHYAAAYGGINHLRFFSDDSVSVNPVICSPQTLKRLPAHLMMFYTGGARAAREILSHENEMTPTIVERLREMKGMCPKVLQILLGRQPLRELGRLLHRAWELKRSLCPRVSNGKIDEYYERARAAGAFGGKLLGAGGAGFLLFFVERSKRRAVRQAISELLFLPVELEHEGSKIVYFSR
jgi:D-glycero-alpha-D-manno-heptose-7-phosphate kinase